MLDLPRFGCINVHGSLLPKYKGAAPIQWAVLNGDAVTGVTTMFMAEGLDTGDIILKKETPIGPDETAGELFDRLAPMGAELLLETIPLLETGTAQRIPQPENGGAYASQLTKEMAWIDWNRPAQEIHNLVRGMNRGPLRKPNSRQTAKTVPCLLQGSAVCCSRQSMGRKRCLFCRLRKRNGRLPGRGSI